MPVFQLHNEIVFPHPSLAESNGLLAVGGDLSPQRLITAYRHGIFPWYSDGEPLLWWFTSPRLVLFPPELVVAKRLARTIRQQRFTVRFDSDFARVIDDCAQTRSANGEGTWITREMQTAYLRLHQLGFVHSVECWQGETLAGGLYGLRLDRVFFGESMFTRVTDASKVALVALVNYLQRRGVVMIDCQMTTAHLLRFGAREIQGKRFLGLLEENIQKISPDGRWSNDEQPYVDRPVSRL
ncbi:MAG: leucyl/phenylalanyl-tRNA--protein transferase [Desulfopila sp.]